MTSLYIGIRGIFQDGGRFGNFQTLIYLLSYSSYGLVTDLADLSFTERRYWYLQSALNPCLKAIQLSVQKPDFPNSLLFLLCFFLSTFIFLLPAKLSLSYQSLLSYFLHTSSALRSRMCERRDKTFSACEFHGCDSAWLCGLTPFKLLLT